MGVRVTFQCDGCNSTEEGTDRLRVHFVGLSGRDYGVGTVQPENSVADVTPHGWIAYDPYTFATYCPTCWQTILSAIDDVVIAASDVEEER